RRGWVDLHGDQRFAAERARENGAHARTHRLGAIASSICCVPPHERQDDRRRAENYCQDFTHEALLLLRVRAPNTRKRRDESHGALWGRPTRRRPLVDVAGGVPNAGRARQGRCATATYAARAARGAAMAASAPPAP